MEDLKSMPVKNNLKFKLCFKLNKPTLVFISLKIDISLTTKE
jgi:hypothetical protein